MLQLESKHWSVYSGLHMNTFTCRCYCKVACIFCNTIGLCVDSMHIYTQTHGFFPYQLETRREPTVGRGHVPAWFNLVEFVLTY